MPSLIVTEIRQITDRISSFLLAATDGARLPTWTPGAHIKISTNCGERSYSLISWPNEQPVVYQIAVQREDAGDGGSHAMHQLKVNDVVQATEPINDFELLDSRRPAALLAGGIGVTPLISMASKLIDENREFSFHYAGRSATEMAYESVLKEAFGKHFLAYYDDDTPLNLNVLMENLVDHDVYICGPKGMIEAARKGAEIAGIDSQNIHVELFSTPIPTTGDTAFEVQIDDSGQVIQVGESQTIIEALEAAGLDVMYDCQRGDCGICQTEVVSGTPDHRDVVLSQAEKDSGKVMQICVSRSKSERLVLAL